MDLSKVRPYGDSLNDGVVQLSFALPLPFGDAAREAARLLLLEMGFAEPLLVHSSDLGENFSFFIAYGRTTKSVDFTGVKVVRPIEKVMGREELDSCIWNYFGRKLVIVGACIETDAHTVGIDAILNMKGFNGHKGLEAYSGFRSINLGSQVSCETLVAKAREIRADALLISQVITQRNTHLKNMTRLIELLEAEEMREDLILVAGGPRISHELAKELGYDAGFGQGTYAEHVASFIVQEMKRRRNSGREASGGNAETTHKRT